MDILIILILAISMVLTFWAIIKKYNPTVTLLAAGLILITIAYFFNIGDGKIPLKKPTDFFFVDIFAVLTENFKATFSGVGMYILTIGGFAYFIEKIGSGQTLVYYAIKPLKKIKNPYIVLALIFYFGVFLNIFIDSAAGLGLLLVATVYPILRELGISKLAAASVISTTGSFAITPLSTIGALNAELLHLPLHEYFFNYKIYTSVFIVLFAGLSHLVWHKYCDNKKSIVISDEDNVETSDLKPGNPLLAIIPLIPIFIMFIPLFNKQIKMDISTVMFASVAISVVLMAIVKKLSLKEVFTLVGEYLSGMSKILSVVILVIAGQIFAAGLIDMGAVTYLIKLGNSLQLGGLGISLIFATIAFLLAAMIGSANAVVIAFANLSPAIAAQFSVPLMMFLMPLHDLAILGRPLAPVAGVVIAVAGITQVNVIDLVRRNCVPMISTAVFAFAINLILLPILLK
ncbi:MAG: C4-dicarboxylate transporter DcuC [Veillonellales bacterium]